MAAVDPSAAHKTKCLVAMDKGAPLQSWEITRRAVGAHDVAIKVLYCGMCHSDVHQIKGEWAMEFIYPMVPGHEIVGTVAAVGKDVKKFKIGDHVGVGCMVDSCGACHECHTHDEQLCQKGAVFTYNGREYTGEPTYGGYSNWLVCKESFVLNVPKNLNLAHAAPLLCAGITTYAPIKRWLKPGEALGVIGLGGLGHMAVKFGNAFGSKVTVISTSQDKEKEAKEVLKAATFVCSKDPEQMKKAVGTLDVIICTAAAKFDIHPYLALLKPYGRFVTLGVAPATNKPDVELSAVIGPLIFQHKILTGSLIGGIAPTQEMLDFCGQHNITSICEVIPADKVNNAIERMVKNDVRYRFVIDIEHTMQ